MILLMYFRHAEMLIILFTNLMNLEMLFYLFLISKDFPPLKFTQNSD